MARENLLRAAASGELDRALKEIKELPGGVIVIDSSNSNITIILITTIIVIVFIRITNLIFLLLL